MNFFNFFSSKKSEEKGGGSGKDPNNNNNQNAPSSTSKSSLKLKYEEKTTNEVESLNNYIKNFQFDKMTFSSYDDFYKIVHFLTSKKNQQNKYYENELDYLYAQKSNKEPKPNESNINKMKDIGKIYVANQTCFDPISIGQNAMILGNNLKIESLNSFVSLMTNNCITSGKWCYEVTLLTNGLMQIGFCQLTTPFTRHGGVGDHQTSFAYDGYRKMKWNKERKEYGKIWDIGDVIGVCIDMDKKNIEYFLNGDSLGIAFNNIPKGENVAFFPGISLSRGESVLFNFGQLPFKYNYKNYHSFDTPVSKINAVDVAINDLLRLWKDNILPLLLNNSKLSEYQYILLNSNIFDFISQHITDPYIFHQVILPFLVEIIIKYQKDQKELQKSIDEFISLILNNFNLHENQKNVGYFFFEHLSLEILERALRMGHPCHVKKIEEIDEKLFIKNINYWENLMKLFMILLKNDRITKLLFEKGTLEVFKNVFNCNWFHMGELMDYL